jgi:hypothetical protein
MKKLLLLLLLIPLIGVGQSRKKQITKLNYQVDSLVDVIDSLYSVIQNQEKTYRNEIKDKKHEISNLNKDILSLEKINDNLNLEISSMQNKIESLNKYINSPYRLSKGNIDGELFSFLTSSNVLTNGRKDLQEMIKINNITLNSTIIEDLNEFPGCGCCDMTAYSNEDFLYFKEGKVLIVEKHYDGDWESGIGDWYDCYLYSPYKKKFEKKLTLRNPLRFSYNYNTDYFIVEQSLVCDTEDTYYIIYNDKLEDVGDIWPVDVFGEIYFGWNEETNEILLKYDRRAFKIYENTNQEWEIKEM